VNQRKKSFLTVTDLFCGAGGSSLGAQKAGVQIQMAANHWRLAIDTHNTNFPETDHDCADVSQVNPRRYPVTDILIASPECTNHSLAKGVRRKQQSQESLFGCETCQKDGEANCPKHSDAVLRSRATMWDVPRFAEHHRYRIIIVENVVDARMWECWDAWLKAMESLGYRWRCVYLNSMFAHPTPQSRDRLYVVFWRRGNRAPDLDIRPRAFCGGCQRDIEAVQSWKPGRSAGRYRRQYIYGCPKCAREVSPYYYAALNAIDWTIKAQRIGDRARPLRERTMGRIRYGMKKYGRTPLLVTTNMTSDGGRSRPVTSPGFTQTGSNLTALVSPAAILHMQGMLRVHGLDEALSTQVASCAQDWVISRGPVIVETVYSDGERRATSGGDAGPTQTTRQSLGVVVPPSVIVTAGSRENQPSNTTSPVPTLTGSERFGVAINPAVIATLRGTGDDQIPFTARPASDAIGTVSAGGIHHALITTPAVLNLRDFRKVEQLVTGSDAALPTQVCGPQTALVGRSPFLVSYYGNDQAAGVDDPIDTLSTRDRHALIDPADDLSIEDCYFRMLQPHEIGAAMAFPDSYVVLGNKRDKVKQYGNAVTPPAMEELIRRCVASLHPEVAA
jgi:DNA (cytosine-5)-methyltransferase 1